MNLDASNGSTNTLNNRSASDKLYKRTEKYVYERHTLYAINAINYACTQILYGYEKMFSSIKREDGKFFSHLKFFLQNPAASVLDLLNCQYSIGTRIF
jgi:hypothetical protein